jgi:hypothetical protein
MRNLLIAALAATAMAATGCEEKKADSTLNQMKDATKSATDAAAKAGDSVKQTVDAATTKLSDEVRALVDTAKAKLDALAKGGANLAADKKPEFDGVMTSLNAQFKTLSEGAAGLKDQAASTLSTRLGELKTMGSKLLADIQAAAEKYGIKV